MRNLLIPTLTLALLVPAARAADAFASYRLPVNLERLTNTALLKGSTKTPASVKLSAEQRRLLGQNGFVVAPARWRQFHQVYEDTRYADIPVFITTDAVYHAYHLAFSKLLRDLERERLAPELAALSQQLAGAAEKQYAALRGTRLEEASRLLLAYLAVGARLANPAYTPPQAVADTVRQELALIDAHAGPGSSAVMSVAGDPYLEDYGQYVPRGHYTRSAALSNYFRAMMWYGRIGFRLKSDRETRAALLLTRLMRSTSGAEARWSRIYDPTSLLVGRSDDLSFRDYGSLMDRVFGSGSPARALEQDAGLAEFRQAAMRLPAPRINSMIIDYRKSQAEQTQGLRLMGQRFVLDAYVFEQLVWREVGTEQKPRLLPRGLDLFAALGNREAYNLLKASGETAYVNYDTQLKKVQQQLGALKPADWTQNLYYNWLYGLQAVASNKLGNTAYPPFMRTRAWARKDLQTALGSWTELKHDTVLYAKQVMAEMGSGPDEVLPRGYVEPNLEAYARLNDLSRRTQASLKARGLLGENSANTLLSLSSMLTFLEGITRKQLANGSARAANISADDYDRIRYFGGWLEEITLASTDSDGGEEGGGPVLNENAQAALVTDVASDPYGKVLQEGTGRIFEIFVVVPDGRGGLQLAKGGTYSHYEFVGSSANRLTDEQWQRMLDSGKAPQQAPWVRFFTAR
ncbi:hypothetical protein HNR42_001041 [Deinobacterium chartae]|uniref:DUF3160 domain-containing protein n=1 Tax=Deinobacterium chartae TaxID=521158 RepID=A0A841HY92_9DEIO|nr:DUF3160 domain-containing protein [Deinobacterium chartae]MBB6097624.1 hypothetical protein [Deinobacterium chartae]